ncbi:DUF2637 domain-containing protein [Streptomyces chumphonensis]|uniref:DUF2637 domain-containing protein n=1 Tax=Streptomyces chumphonensis TaxID=1214925 RepID=UPI003D725ACD
MSRLLARVDAVLIQAVIAGALSFAHLHDLALAAGQDGWKAWAYPVSVDLLLVAAWHRLRNGDASGKAVAWCWFLTALAASLGANVATAGLLDLQAPPDWLRILVAGWPALAFFGGTLLAHQHTRPADPASAAEPPEVERVERADLATPAPEPVPVPAELPAPQPAPEPAPDPDPEPVPAPEASASPDAGPQVPAALIDHARKLSADHQHRTGHPIDAEALRARLGIPGPMAATIVRQLT